MVNIDTQKIKYYLVVFVLGICLGLYAGYYLFSGRADVSDIRNTVDAIGKQQQQTDKYQQNAAVAIDRATAASGDIEKRAGQIKTGLDSSAAILEENAAIYRQIRESGK